MCVWMSLVLIVATITIGVLSATIYKDKWSVVWVNVIAADCEPNCELESCFVTCDMYVSYKCKSELVYYNFTSNVMDRTYHAGDKMRSDLNNDDCELELDARLPLGNLFLYMCVGGLAVLLVGISVVGSVLFVYRRDLDHHNVVDVETGETTPLKQIKTVNNKVCPHHYELPHVHF
jgi:hypothetical protein